MEKEIEETRKLMIEIATSTGLGSQETLKVSQKLDALINRYENYQSKFRGEKLSRKR
ncbi:aspartyl-phosphate phosphatase Spo0E family protein [Sporosarcina sp. Marseille-Q4063]|uniref:aspartyl-phosphate phosphatase Spo0E family protein n=1 Tax=Sporosarcina sp. Marseille-Q4063 TaxID=2810514 RepID=UPI001BAEA42B|nr:aspartyl-phosphate phosphatase Spo0E family protein [Sporosarcina sp. Marseille-Q4063]QUW21712.1 aspartyl-phosphate phosphatase Spo0E family protein [Sporosarcina sp. Marseille-Q4063]